MIPLPRRQIEDALLIAKLQPHPLDQIDKRRAEKIDHAMQHSELNHECTKTRRCKCQRSVIVSSCLQFESVRPRDGRHYNLCRCALASLALARYIRRIEARTSMASCVTRIDLHPLRRDVPRREPDDGRSDVDGLPAVRADGWHPRHRLRPGPRAGSVEREAAGRSAAKSLAVCGAVAAGAGRRFATIGRSVIRRSSIRRRLAQHLGVQQILLKDEGRNPTGSFKDRSSAVGVAHALQVGAKTIACASTGNAASSLAGHAALAGSAGVHFCAAHRAGAEGRAVASVRRDRVRREGIV